MSGNGLPYTAYPKGDRVLVHYFQIFDANTQEADSMSALFARAEFERCLSDASQRGVGEVSENGSRLRVRALKPLGLEVDLQVGYNGVHTQHAEATIDAFFN